LAELLVRAWFGRKSGAGEGERYAERKEESEGGNQRQAVSTARGRTAPSTTKRSGEPSGGAGPAERGLATRLLVQACSLVVVAVVEVHERPRTREVNRKASGCDECGRPEAEEARSMSGTPRLAPVLARGEGRRVAFRRSSVERPRAAWAEELGRLQRRRGAPTPLLRHRGPGRATGAGWKKVGGSASGVPRPMSCPEADALTVSPCP
jgi:hypothetical protein